MKPWLNWESLPELFDWKTNQPDPQLDISIAAIFRQRYAIRVVQFYLWRLSRKPWCGFARLPIWTRG